LPNPFLVFRSELPFIELTGVDRLREEATQVAELITKPVTTGLANPLDATGAPTDAAGALEPAVGAPPPRYRPALVAYITIVVGAFVALEVFLVRGATTFRPTNVGTFGLFTVLAFVAELRPLSWLGPSKKYEISTSWTFLLCLFLSSPIPTAAATMFFIVLLSSAVRRVSILFGLLNASMGSLALTFAALTVSSAGSAPIVLQAVGAIDQRWVVSTIAIGLFGFAADLVMASIGAAIHLRVSFLRFLQNAVANLMAMHAMPIGLAPAFILVSRTSLLAGALLTLTVGALYKTTETALLQRHAATHDPLTSLSNRRSFQDQAAVSIAVASRRQHTLFVLQLSVDGFKSLNDRLGRAVGDDVLQKVAERLQDDRRAGDLVARLDANDFAILLPGPCSADEARAVAARIIERLQTPLELAGVPLKTTVSIGMAEFPAHGEDIDTLLSKADMALYRAKKANKSPELYTDDHTRTGPTRMMLAGEIQEAMRHNEFFLAYQPKLDLHSGAFIGVEALVRWLHPERGILYPDAFIPTAEQTDLMQDLTEYVIDRALKQCALWHDEGLYVTMAVNVSARNLHNHDFVDMVSTLLDRHHIDPMWLELELTENTVMVDPERTALVLQELRTLGVQISLDDFGTGFSSLANLRNLPIDRVKIDKTFVFGMLHSPKDESIVRSIIDLATNLGMGTVAEGVESQEVLDRLALLNCEAVQGYFIAKPISAIEIRNLLNDGSLTPVPRPVSVP
jgi:diguanylate cyclase (GGDEF)-like protein